MHSAELEPGEVNTDVFSLQCEDQSVLLLPLSFLVQHKGMESCLGYPPPLRLKASPLPSGAKKLPVEIFPSTKEIFKDPLL